MQMYKVAFQTHYENAVDVGCVLVCASDQQAATAMAIRILQLPTSRTQMQVERVKPSIYLLHKKQLPKERDKKKAPHRDVILDHRYHCDVSVTLSGKSEKHAIRKVAESLFNRSAGKSDGLRMKLDCAPVEERRELKAIEKVDLYQAKNLVQRPLSKL